MGLAERILIGAQRDAGDDFVDGAERYGTVDSALLGRQTDAAEVVDVNSAMRLTAMYAAISLRANTVGAMPLITYEKNGKQRRKAKGTDAYRLLLREPNDSMSPIDFLSRIETHLCCFGEAIIGKSMVGDRVDALWPIDPDRVIRIRRERGVKVFTVQTAKGVKDFDGRYMIHIPLLAWRGLRGISPIALHRETLGGAIALERYGNRVFRNGAILRGVVTLQGTVSQNARREFKKEWHALYSRENQHGVAVLDEGAAFNPIALPLRDAEYIANRKLTVADIGRMQDVPASMIGGGTEDSLTYKTLEGDATNWLKFGLQGRSLTRIEQGFMRDRDLYPDPDQRYCEFLVEQLLRGTTLDRYRAYAIGVKSGFLVADEIREKENLGPLPAGSQPPTQETDTDVDPSAA